jgi:triphosphoribosyl-dephospho-CoA synthase
MASEFSIGECAQLACVLEATAGKPGNVTRFHDFADMTYLDFIVSAAAIAPVFERTAELGVGGTVLEAVRATRRLVKVNTNLGILLLLAPLAAVPRERRIRDGIGEMLDALTVDDSRAVFEAIRLANPGGLGEAPEQDVRDEPTLPLRGVMALAADRDLVARQYANGFREVFDIGVPALLNGPLEPAIVRSHLRLLSNCLESHIERKCGPELAHEASTRAAVALAGDSEAIATFDAWLRADNHRRNPGSTADLVAASLFVALREGMIAAPFEFSPLDIPAILTGIS